MIHRLTLFAILLTVGGCLPYKKLPTPATLTTQATESERDRQIRATAAADPLYRVIPRDRRQIYWFDVPHWVSWGLLGNEHDGIFGEDSNPPFTQTPNFKSFLAWYARNPLNNFCFYVIGSADWKTHYSFNVFKSDPAGLQLLSSDPKPSVFSKDPGGFIFALNDFKPFVSIKFPMGKAHAFDFYLGWRPEGHFGIKFRPWLKSNWPATQP